jgi:hypothetical protein
MLFAGEHTGNLVSFEKTNKRFVKENGVLTIVGSAKGCQASFSSIYFKAAVSARRRVTRRAVACTSGGCIQDRVLASSERTLPFQSRAAH